MVSTLMRRSVQSVAREPVASAPSAFSGPTESPAKLDELFLFERVVPRVCVLNARGLGRAYDADALPVREAKVQSVVLVLPLAFRDDESLRMNRSNRRQEAAFGPGEDEIFGAHAEGWRCASEEGHAKHDEGDEPNEAEHRKRVDCTK